jgi:hypothetical protein
VTGRHLVRVEARLLSTVKDEDKVATVDEVAPVEVAVVDLPPENEMLRSLVVRRVT